MRGLIDADGILVADSHAAVNVAGRDHSNNESRERFFYSSLPALGGGMSDRQSPGFSYIIPERVQTFTMVLGDAGNNRYTSDFGWSLDELHALRVPKPR